MTEIKREASIPESEKQEILREFRDLISSNIAVPVCAMKALESVIRRSNATTFAELEKTLQAAILCLKICTASDLLGKTSMSLDSGCELFMKYVSRAIKYGDFVQCKADLISRAEKIAGTSLRSRHKISEVGHSFVQDGCTVLIHGNSRVVTALLMKAAESKQFNVVFTDGRPNADGLEAAKVFIDAGIPTTVILDAAVGKYMEHCDLCLVGAEMVMENGGIVNKLGTFQVAIVAKAMKKPFYVAVESYKFARVYPLCQRDISDMCGGLTAEDAVFGNGKRTASAVEVTFDRYTIDFTPAEYITLLFTDLGVLTPAAVSDELIKLYQ